MTGLVGRGLAEGPPHKVFVKPRHHPLIRKTEPVFQDHEPHHQPRVGFGRTSHSGGAVQGQDPVELLSVDLSGQHHRGVVRIHMPVGHPLEQALLGSRSIGHNPSSRRKGEKPVRSREDL